MNQNVRAGRFLVLLAGACALAVGCGDVPDSTMPYVAPGPGGKAEGPYTCKPPVEAEPMSSPEITISIADPPMVRLRDLDTGEVRHYRAGVGVLKNGVSRSWEPVIFAGTKRFTVKPQAPEAGCRTRVWADPHSDDTAAYYAGLPWMPFRGYYAIHGPIDRYWDANGGTLNPGYVSHGCIRMASFDIRELYAQIKHQTAVPLILTKDGFGPAAEQEAYYGGWIMDTCSEDHDCRGLGAGHACRKSSATAADGLCTKRCSRTCPDRIGRAMSFCIADLSDETSGYCVNRAEKADQCAAGQAFEEDVSRFGDEDYEPQSVCKPALEQP